MSARRHSKAIQLAHLVCALAILSASQPAMAGPPACLNLFGISYRPQDKFGSEFTVTNQEIIDESMRFTGEANTGSILDQMMGKIRKGVVQVPGAQGFDGHPVKKMYYDRLVKAIAQKCKSTGLCRKIRASFNKHHDETTGFELTDGFYFWVGADEKCLEFGAKPDDAGEVNYQRLQEWLLDPAAAEGLFPHEVLGAGQVSVSRAIFNESTRHLKNFSNDFQNRPEIFWALGSDMRNASMVASLQPDKIDAYERIDRELDLNKTHVSMEQYMDHLETAVFTQPYGFDPSSTASGAYYTAFNMRRARGDKYTPSERRFEFRGIRPQENAYVYKLQVIFLERWISRVGEIKGDIPFVRKDRYGFSNQEVVDSFAALLKELDLPFGTFKEILPKEMRASTPSSHPRSRLPYRLKNLRDGRGIRKPLRAADLSPGNDRNQQESAPTSIGFPKAYSDDPSGHR